MNRDFFIGEFTDLNGVSRGKVYSCKVLEKVKINSYVGYYQMTISDEVPKGVFMENIYFTTGCMQLKNV